MLEIYLISTEFRGELEFNEGRILRDALEKMWFNSSWNRDGTKTAAGISGRQNAEVGRDHGQPSLCMEFKG